MVLKGSFWENF